MKNYSIFFSLVILMLTANRTIAQTPVDIGLKGGLSMPNLTSGSSSNPINSGYTSRLGADAAVVAEFYLSKHFSLQPQLEYSAQGGKKNGYQAFAVPGDLQQSFP